MTRDAKAAEAGFVLVAALWLAMLLGLVAGGIVIGTRTEATLARNFALNTQAQALADAGIMRAMIDLADPARAEAWTATRRRHRLDLSSGHAAILIEDEDGKVDLNLASAATLSSLLRSVGVPAPDAAELAARSVARRATTRDGGQAAGDVPNGMASDRDSWTSLAQLLMTPSLSPDVYRRLKSLATVHSRASAVDPKVASDEVREMLRRDPISEPVPAAVGQSQGSRLHAAASRRLIYTVRSLGCVHGGRATFLREAVIRRSRATGRLFDILAWQGSSSRPDDLSCS